MQYESPVEDALQAERSARACSNLVSRPHDAHVTVVSRSVDSVMREAHRVTIFATPCVPRMTQTG